jgi:hypothetical protein
VVAPNAALLPVLVLVNIGQYPAAHCGLGDTTNGFKVRGLGRGLGDAQASNYWSILTNG